MVCDFFTGRFFVCGSAEVNGTAVQVQVAAEKCLNNLQCVLIYLYIKVLVLPQVLVLFIFIYQEEYK